MFKVVSMFSGVKGKSMYDNFRSISGYIVRSTFFTTECGQYANANIDSFVTACRRDLIQRRPYFGDSEDDFL
jgi:hypothetical protein